MGGSGSGRRWSCQTKKKAEHCASLDVRRLHRDGVLQPGRSFPQNWRQNGQLVATIMVTVAEDRVVLSYQRLIARAEWRSERYPVMLERVSCNYGGRRVWFRCPTPGCERRVAILYLRGTFACRHCHQIAYASQRIQPWERALTQAQAIRERLGGTANMYEAFPQRPKGMHRRTYLELRRQYDHANANSWPGWVRRWKMHSCVKA